MGKNLKDLRLEYYVNQYNQIVNKGFNGWLFSFTHKNLEHIPSLKSGKRRETALKILEVGSGSGEHIKFVESTFQQYIATDLAPELLGINTSELKSRGIQFQQADVENLRFKKNTFNRVICTCLLHHMNDPESALLEMKRVTKMGGLVSIYISCDPGILNRFLRTILIKPKARKLGFFEYDIFIAREHRGHFQSIQAMIQKVFNGQEIQQKFYPFHFKSWNLNTFSVFQITIISK